MAARYGSTTGSGGPPHNQQKSDGAVALMRASMRAASVSRGNWPARGGGQVPPRVREQRIEVKAQSLPLYPEQQVQQQQQQRVSGKVFNPPTSRPRTCEEKKEEEGINFAQFKGHPETLVVYRSNEERAANPERLNLDRRHLTSCPVLRSEERVRLLNYQNNSIQEIRHLGNLPNLIFLDLYNNCIERLSKSLDDVPTLRVLMLGKNRISQIHHLDKLKKLDVLDLHSNVIQKIENLENLTELRVLNVAGNRITVLENLTALHSLTELNVRRNLVEKAVGLDQLPALQRVFASNNKVTSLTDVDCLFRSRYLTELSLDGNPAVLADPRLYRKIAVERLKTLRHLDLKKITDSERRAVLLEAAKQGGVFSSTTADPPKKQQQQPSSSLAIEPFLPQVSSPRDPPKKPPTSPRKSPRKQSSSSSTTTRKQSDAGYFEVQVDGEERSLQMYGEAFEYLDQPKLMAPCTSLICRFVAIEKICNRLRPHSKLLSKIHTVVLADTNLTTLAQISTLMTVFTSIQHLDVTSNPVSSLALLRPFVAAFDRPRLKSLNGLPFVATDRRPAFKNLVSRFSSSLHHHQKKLDLKKKKVHVDKAISNALAADAKRRLFDRAWPNVLSGVIRDALDPEYPEAFLSSHRVW